MKYWRLAMKQLGLKLSEQMAYKGDFFIKLFAGALADFVGPLVAILIYASTPGIPGWSLNEFLLFQGTLILVFALGKFAAVDFNYHVFDALWDGEFDHYLLKPYDSLKLLLAKSVNTEAFFEIALGMALIIYAFAALDIGFSLNVLLYLVLILAGLAIQVSSVIYIGALSFLVIKSDALLQFWWKFTDFARYPLNVYSPWLKFLFTFGIPVAVSAFYPANVLLHGTTLLTMVEILVPVIVFSAISVWLWYLGIRKYTSTG